MKRIIAVTGLVVALSACSTPKNLPETPIVPTKDSVGAQIMSHGVKPDLVRSVFDRELAFQLEKANSERNAYIKMAKQAKKQALIVNQAEGVSATTAVVAAVAEAAWPIIAIPAGITVGLFAEDLLVLRTGSRQQIYNTAGSTLACANSVLRYPAEVYPMESWQKLVKKIQAMPDSTANKSVMLEAAAKEYTALQAFPALVAELRRQVDSLVREKGEVHVWKPSEISKVLLTEYCGMTAGLVTGTATKVCGSLKDVLSKAKPAPAPEAKAKGEGEAEVEDTTVRDTIQKAREALSTGSSPAVIKSSVPTKGASKSEADNSAQSDAEDPVISVYPSAVIERFDLCVAQEVDRLREPQSPTGELPYVPAE